MARSMMVVVVVAVVVLLAVPDTVRGEPTVGVLGRAVQRLFRDGVRTMVGGGGEDGDERHLSDGAVDGLVPRFRAMLEDSLRTRFLGLGGGGGDVHEADARSESGGGGDTLDSLRPSPTTQIIGRFVANAISALQKPDGIVASLRQKTGFVTSNFRLSCYVCEMGVGLAKQFVYANKSLDEVGVTLGNVCNLLTVTSERVCHGFLNEFLPEIMYVLRRIDLLDEEVCGFLLGGNCIGRTYMDTFAWNVNIPQRGDVDAQVSYRRKPYANKLKVLHITDVHVDDLYAEGSTVDCGEPLCCRDKKRGFGLSQHRAGKWGSTGRCDTPVRTVDSLLDHLKASHEFDYIMWTGDVPPHDIWAQTRADNLAMTERFNQKLKAYFPDTPIYPCVGNHESFPANSFPSPALTKSPFNTEYLFQALNASWSHLVPGNISDTVLQGAFYSVLARPGLRIISINSNYCHNKNWWLLLDDNDPAGMLQWLVDELDKAERNGEKVHIIGHIAPGSVDCHYVWTDNFNSIVTRYQDTIVAQFYGHSHLDEFQIFYDKFDNVPINMAYVGPSVTPYDGVNPSYKIYYVDGDYEGSPREILDYETYFLDLDEANANDNPTWDILYSAKDSFGLRSMQPKEWDRLVSKLASNNDLFKDFYKFMYRRTNKKTCTGICKELTLCRLRKAWAGATKEC